MGESSVNDSLWRTADELAARRSRLLRSIAAEGLDAVVITSPASREYYSGFAVPNDDDHPTAAVVIGRSDAALFTHANNIGWATAMAPGLPTRRWTAPWWPTLAGVFADRGWTAVGFEAFDLSVHSFRQLADTAGNHVSLTEADNLIIGPRAVKSDAEIATLRRAVEVTDTVFAQVQRELRVGMTERAVAQRIDALMVEHGASGPGFQTIVASGRNAARPHHDPDTTAITEGTPVIIDMGARVDGYTADLTRTVWVGTPDPRLVELYPIVAEANRAAQTAARTGVTGADIDAAGRAVIEAAGCGEAFVHGLGHGVGLRIHEAPAANRTSTTLLRAGEILTIEPGIYLPDWGGIRIEDLGVITDDGFVCLSRAAKEPPSAS